MLRGAAFQTLVAGAAVALLLISGTPTSAQATNPVEYKLIIDCPGLDENVQAARNELECPIRIIDTEDILGSPSVMVDPRNEDNVVFASLHGGDGDGPTQRSRKNQVFTTHVSEDHGATWNDRPFFPPEEIRRLGAFGEHPQVTVDLFGRVYVGSLYSVPDDDSPSGYTYRIGSQKFESVPYIIERQSTSGSYHLGWVDTYTPGNIVQEFWLIHDPKTDTMSVVWNELKPDGATGGKSVIGIRWTKPALKEDYHRIDAPNLIGPCLDTTNPVLADDHIYIGCLVNTVEGGYAWDESPEKDQIDLFRLDIPSGKPQYLGHAPIRGGNPKLGVRSDGRLFLVTAGLGADGSTRVFGAFGHYDQVSHLLTWGPSHNYGPEIAPAVPGQKTTEVNIQDLMFREYSGVVHMIIKERITGAGLVVDDMTGFAQPQFRKTLVAIDEKNGFLLKLNFDVGNPVNRTAFSQEVSPNQLPSTNIAGSFATNEDVFNDLTDDIYQLPPAPFKYADRDLGPKYQREFYAIGDYGVVSFAEVIEITNLVGPVGGPLNAPPPPNPAAALGLNIATVGTAAGGLALTGLLAYRLALARKSTFNPAAVKQEK